MVHRSAPELLALHGVRVLGAAVPGEVAARYRLDADAVQEHLLDAEARGWVRTYSFAGRTTWSITDAGRSENERQLAAELDAVGARQVATEAHAAFLPLNRRFGSVCTKWQIRPTARDRMAANDHTDWAWDEQVLRSLASLGDALARALTPLTDALSRFDGHVDRYRAALSRVERGGRPRVDPPDRASAHIVWIHVHEDLRALLGIER